MAAPLPLLDGLDELDEGLLADLFLLHAIIIIQFSTPSIPACFHNCILAHQHSDLNAVNNNTKSGVQKREQLEPVARELAYLRQEALALAAARVGLQEST